MIIKGNRRGGAKQLAAHLLRRDTNEEVIIREIEGYPEKLFADHDLKAALSFMAAQGLAQSKLRTLYHSIIAPQDGEILSQKQLRHAVDTLAKNLGLEGHQRVVVEHHKDGRQHFHIVFSILHPETGKQARLQWTRKIEWNTGRQLEKELGLKPVPTKGRASKQWEHQRGKRSGIDPQNVRKEVTAIYHASRTGREFVANLHKAGYVLTKGDKGQYVLVDKAGDIHGLMRRIEGVKIKDLRQKFPDLKDIQLPSLASVLKARRPVRQQQPAQKVVRQYRRAKRKIYGRQRRPKPRNWNKSFRFNKTKLFRSVRTGAIAPVFIPMPVRPISRPSSHAVTQSFRQAWFPMMRRGRKRKPEENEPEKMPFSPDSGPMSLAELIAWAWANGRWDILAMYGIIDSPETFEP